MDIKIKSLITLTLILTANSSHCRASDATFTLSDNQLQIPFVRFEDQFFLVNLSLLPPDQLILDNIVSQSDSPKNNEIVPVYSDLSFHLSNIAVSNKQYAADISLVEGNIFQIHQLTEIEDAAKGGITFQSQHFSGSGICAQCHNNLSDNEGNDVSIVSAWSTTMMANSTRDPFWQAKVKSELNRTPSQQQTINDTCSRCHAPMANEEARKQNAPIQAIFDEGILNPQNPYHDLAQNGVSCTLCHQISPVENFGTDAGFSGNFSIATFPTSTERLIYGPFEHVLTKPMQSKLANFTPVYGAHIKSSELCASCHDLLTPYTDELGNIISNQDNEFPEQMPYSEWLHSDYVNTDSCQQCHMPRADGVIIASEIDNLPKRDDFAQHNFLGSNSLMLSILQDYRELLGVTSNDFSSSILSAEQLLKNAAELEVINPELTNATLKFGLKINSKTGHKLPSGYPSRRVILHVVIRDAQDNIVFETGKVNTDGSVLNLDSDQHITQYEPHYEEITSPEQVQVYEAIMQDYQNNITYTLLRAKSYLKDNRILPQGFDKQNAPYKIQVHGVAASDTNFVGGSDIVKFNVGNLPDAKYQLEAELIYQTLAYAFAQDLFTDSSEEVSRFKQMFNVSSLKSTPMGKIHFSISKDK